MPRNWKLFMVALATAAAASWPMFSCGDDTTSNPDVTDTVGGDADADADVTPGACPTTPEPAMPEMRLQTLHVTAPEAMTGELFGNLLNTSLENETFIWLVQFTGVGTGTISLQTGSGTKVAGSVCNYNFLAPEYPPATVFVAETGLHFELAGDPIPVLEVAIWSEGTAYPELPLVMLPLQELDISGDFAAGHLTIGTYDAVREEWTDAGTLAGKITIDDAMLVPIPDLGITLCGLLSGDTRTPGNMADDCTSPQADWTHQPDTTAGGDDAYSLAGTFAASAVNILP